jgi:hypothetical protein
MDERKENNNTPQRESSGRFAKGNTINIPFPKDNNLTLKYKPEYDEDIVRWFIEQAESSINYPTFQRYARKIGVLATTLRHWAENNLGGFADAYRTCKEIQEEVLMVRTLGKAYEPSFAKFVAVNTLGMVDQSSLTVQGNEEKPLTVSIEIVG